MNETATSFAAANPYIGIFSSSAFYLSKACAKSEVSGKMFYFIEEKLLQGIAESIKKGVGGAGSVSYFYSLLKLTALKFGIGAIAEDQLSPGMME